MASVLNETRGFENKKSRQYPVKDMSASNMLLSVNAKQQSG